MGYFLINSLTDDEVLQFENSEDVAQYIIDNVDMSDAYDEYLDCDGAVDVAGLSFYPSTILKECDHIAYNCGYSDFQDSVYTDIKEDLDRMSDGDENEFYGEEVEYHEYEDDDE